MKRIPYSIFLFLVLGVLLGGAVAYLLGQGPARVVWDAPLGDRLYAATTGKSQSQYFTSSGTFTVPANVTAVWVTAWGGGGGGGSCGSQSSGGGGGGGGEIIFRLPARVESGASIAVTVGSGGTATVDGSNSVFAATSTTVTAKGGKGGVSCTTGTGGAGGGVLGGAVGARGLSTVYVVGGAGGGNNNGGHGAGSPLYQGGWANTSANGTGGGGGGGGFKGAGGSGGEGNSNCPQYGGNGAANSGAGGGGAGCNGGGGTGGSGGVLVEWIQ
jgi:hypothetical protein